MAEIIDLNSLPATVLRDMKSAADEVKECERVLAKTGDTVLTELLRDEGEILPWRHYPLGDVYDPEFHAQYYFHAHPPGERPAGEYGHFHTFVRRLGLPDEAKPAPLPDYRPAKELNDEVCHIVGIATNSEGGVCRLFTTNRWVTGETWFPAATAQLAIDCFLIDHARPSWVVNRWITALIQLFKPQIAALLEERDVAVDRHRDGNPTGNVFEDAALEVTSELKVSVSRQIIDVERALSRSRRRRPISRAS